jgi:alkanesulfonate monooxygenase SsuD/methylene tetrahydromethanopterin reductase-like flavin-dependent oxidoreductase (luciferase family)
VRIAIGLPNAVPADYPGRLVVDWGRQAEARGFASVATIGRIAFPVHEELIALAAVAAVTERIGLFTDVLLGPARQPTLLAIQAATLDQVSGGRLVLGVGVGGRPDDFELAHLGFRDRGRRWDAALESIHRIWSGETRTAAGERIGPPPANGRAVPLLFGGGAEQAIARTVRWGIGHTQGGGPPERLHATVERVTRAWSEARREGRPEFRALVYFALGPDAGRGEDTARRYYGEFGDRAWGATIKDADSARQRATAFEAAGCDELVFFPTVAALDQVDLLADAVL